MPQVLQLPELQLEHELSGMLFLSLDTVTFVNIGENSLPEHLLHTRFFSLSCLLA